MQKISSHYHQGNALHSGITQKKPEVTAVFYKILNDET